jgi:alpha-1,3-mannosyltransferase
MQEVKGYLDGNYDYTQLKGDTGPCVYPAGFVYVFSFFYYITDEGKNIQTAQLIYLYIYLANLYVVFEIYKTIEGNISVLTYVLCCLSYRMHSIFILRLFNDPVAMLFMNICILFCCYNRWQGALFLYSIALSIKMNILLYLPAFLLLICWARGFRAALTTLTTIILWQILIAYPFLKVNSAGYLERAFNFGRQFTQIWSVNWQFLPSEVFLSSYLHISLLLLHILLIFHFLISKASSGRTLLERYKSLNLPCSWQEFKTPTNNFISPQGNLYLSCDLLHVHDKLHRNSVLQVDSLPVL